MAAALGSVIALFLSVLHWLCFGAFLPLWSLFATALLIGSAIFVATTVKDEAGQNALLAGAAWGAGLGLIYGLTTSGFLSGTFYGACVGIISLGLARKLGVAANKWYVQGLLAYGGLILAQVTQVIAPTNFSNHPTYRPGVFADTLSSGKALRDAWKQEEKTGRLLWGDKEYEEKTIRESDYKKARESLGR